jgi:branched-subunit amino acid ABC-type transport system permease component
VSTVTFLLLGLGNGAVFAALGVSLAISYRTSNVVNFGAGTMALFGAVIYQTVRTQHAIFNPLAASLPLVLIVLVLAVIATAVRWQKWGIPGPTRLVLTAATTAAVVALALQPPRINIGANLGTALALIVTCVVSAILGLILYMVVFRRLRDALPLTRVVAAIGVLLVGPALVTNRFNGNPIDVPTVLPGAVWRLGRVIIQENQLCLAGIVIAVALVLGLLYRKTRFGLKTTAVAETDLGATIIGISPNWIGGANWAIGGAVAGMFGALIATFAPVAPIDFEFFVISGLAAAMVGGMSSLGWATVAGLAIGMLQSEAQYLATRYTFLPQQGFTDVVPLLLLVVVMLVRSKALPERGALIKRSLPSARPPRHVLQWTIALTAIGLGLAFTLHGNYQVGLSTSLIGVLFALSLVVLLGFVGQISLAQYMFAGVAAFLLSRFTLDWGLPFPIAPLLSAMVVCIVGALMAVPAVRVRGVNLAILTLATGLAVEDIYFTNATYVGGGGSPTVVNPTLFGLKLGIGSHGYYPRPEFAVMMLVIVIPVALGVVGLRRSSLGLQMLAVRANERAAAANGIHVARVKMLAFTISAFIAGLAGAFVAYINYGGFSSASFDVLLSVTLVALVYIAGIAMVSGAIIAGIGFAGGLFTILLQQVFPLLPAWYGVFAGVGLIMTAITIPEGLAGLIAEGAPPPVRRLLQLARRPKVPVAPSLSDQLPPVSRGIEQFVAGGLSQTSGPEKGPST